MTDTAKKGELLLSDMSEPLAHMAQAHEALSRAVIPEEVLEWIGVSDVPFISRLDGACNEVDAIIDSAEKCALAACDNGDADVFEHAVKTCLNDLAAFDMPDSFDSIFDIDEMEKALTIALMERLRDAIRGARTASVSVKFAAKSSIDSLENALR